MEASKVIFAMALSMCFMCISSQSTQAPGGLGSYCTRTSDCSTTSIGNVVCKDNICTCDTNTVPNEDNNKCLSTAPHDQPCIFSVQCNYSDNAECISGRCNCVSGFQYNGTKCIGNLRLGAQCITDQQCIAENDPSQQIAYCFNGQCSCKFGYIREDKNCVIGGDCTNDTYCESIENSFCNNLQRDRFKCACKNTFVSAVNNTKCLPSAKKVDEGCDDDAQCTLNLGEAHCIKRLCKCKDGVRAIENNTKCGAPVTTAISLSCLVLLILVKLL